MLGAFNVTLVTKDIFHWKNARVDLSAHHEVLFLIKDHFEESLDLSKRLARIYIVHENDRTVLGRSHTLLRRVFSLILREIFGCVLLEELLDGCYFKLIVDDPF